MRSAELFAGCGGLALGLGRAGFEPELMAEWNSDAVATVLHNVTRDIEHVGAWPMRQMDVRAIDWSPLAGELDLISGGPPCQPFAIGGLKAGDADARDMWPEAIRAIREARPRAFLFENVRNLAGPKFRSYLDWVLACLARPDDTRRAGEARQDHLDRLRRSRKRADYRVCWQVVNAADYGSAQIRHRVLIFGIREDLGVQPEPMRPTHSRAGLERSQADGSYWKRHRIANPNENVPTTRSLPVAHGLPWVTLRDAIKGLGKPNGRNAHVFRDGARAYAGHTGSPLDLPSKALKAGDHGVPGGENMIAYEDGTVRYLTTREAARLVGLPDDYAFPNSWTESMRQLGNAVPVPLAEAAGRHMARLLGESVLPLFEASAA
jgi:DNA (cytosine-5)-methyltransferase 1